MRMCLIRQLPRIIVYFLMCSVTVSFVWMESKIIMRKILSLFACNLDYSLFKEERTADEFYKWPIVIGY